MPRRRLRSLLWVNALECRDVPATFTVLNTNDTGTGSLRQAISSANSTSGADSIVFDTTVFATPQTITLTTGQLSISDVLTITGPAATATINGNNKNRIFSIDVFSKNQQPISITDLTLINGNGSAPVNGGAISNSDEALTLTRVTIRNCQTNGRGGAVYVTNSGGSANLVDCQLVNNSAIGDSAAVGGAVAAISINTAVTVTRCTFSGNASAGSGGAIAVGSSGVMITLTDSTFANNRVTSSTVNGGAVLMAQGTIRGCTFTGNSAVNGGAIQASGATFQNCTIIGNSASNQGGGILGNAINLQNCTVISNTAGVGGGLFINAANSFLASSVVARNSGNDVQGSVTADNCLFGTTTGATITGSNNVSNVDPVLAPLNNYGGPTPTCPPMAGSPVVNTGSNPANLTTDQRGAGFPRVLGPAADIGACEGSLTIPVGIAAAPPVTTFGTTTTTFTVTYYDDQGIDVDSLNTGDITISGPNGFVAPAVFVGVDINTNGSPRTATYQITAPGGYWDPSDNGTYQISTVAGQVIDIDAPIPNGTVSGVVGSFQVNVQHTYVVFNTNDSGPGSLRQAVLDSNAASGADAIVFDPAAFSAPATIKLTGGPLFVTGPLTITGPAARVTVDANLTFRILQMQFPNGSPAQSVSISHLTLTRGYAGDVPNSPFGGGINATGCALTLADVAITQCWADYGGAGVYVDFGTGGLTVTDCVFDGNSKSPFGTTSEAAAIDCYTTGAVSIARTTITNNKSGFGAVQSGSPCTISDCTISGNTATAATGTAVYFFNPTQCTIRNSTISGNSAAHAVFAWNSTLAIQNSTIANNSGDGIGQKTATVNIDSSIVAKNGNVGDIGGPVTANFSLIGNTAGATIAGSNNVLNVDPLLGPLANNGGNVKTHALLPGSPAINTGSNPANLLTDERGNARTVGVTDIGAFEVQAPATVTSIIVNGGAAQRSLVKSVTINFNQHIGGISAAAFSLTRVGDNAPVTLAASADETGPGTAITLTFTGGAVNGTSLADGRYALHILASGFPGEGFDGNNDGIAQGSPADDYAFDEPAAPAALDLTKLFRLFGDSDGNGNVDAVDFGAFRQAFNSTNSIFDFDGNGVVDGIDFGQFRQRYGVTI